MVLVRTPSRIRRLLTSQTFWGVLALAIVVIVSVFTSSISRMEMSRRVNTYPDIEITETQATTKTSTSASRGELFTRIRVFFATDRQPLIGRTGYGHAWSEDLRYGVAEVSIPRDHRLGAIESPSVWRLEFRRDPTKHVVLHSADEMSVDAFTQDLRQAVESSSEGHLLLFIHGFNVSFESAIMRTAQIFYDLSLPGVPVAYAWPSRAELGPIAYVADGNMSDVTTPHLKRFLIELAQRSGAKRIHVIAHSMGNKVLARALDAMAGDRAVPAQRYFHNIALTAPDIDERLLRDIAGRVNVFAVRTTLYASSNDEALRLAARYTKSRRAGQGGPGIFILPPIDTIDASSVDTSLVGHFYYGSNLSVLSDIYYLFRAGEPPDRRFLLRPMEIPRGKYWAFRQ